MNVLHAAHFNLCQKSLTANEATTTANLQVWVYECVCVCWGLFHDGGILRLQEETMIPVHCCAARLYLACVAVCVERAWQHRGTRHHSAHVNMQSRRRLRRAEGCFTHNNADAHMLMCIFQDGLQ